MEYRLGWRAEKDGDNFENFGSWPILVTEEEFRCANKLLNILPLVIKDARKYEKIYGPFDNIEISTLEANCQEEEIYEY